MARNGRNQPASIPPPLPLEESDITRELEAVAIDLYQLQRRRTEIYGSYATAMAQNNATEMERATTELAKIDRQSEDLRHEQVRLTEQLNFIKSQHQVRLRAQWQASLPEEERIAKAAVEDLTPLRQEIVATIQQLQTLAGRWQSETQRAAGLLDGVNEKRRRLNMEMLTRPTFEFGAIEVVPGRRFHSPVTVTDILSNMVPYPRRQPGRKMLKAFRNQDLLQVGKGR